MAHQPTAGSISTILETDPLEAGQTVDVTVRFVAERPAHLTGGTVELIRNAVVTRFQRQWSGAGSTVSDRVVSVVATAALRCDGPVAAGEPVLRTVQLAVPPGEATIAGYLVQQEYVLRARARLEGGQDVEDRTDVRVVPGIADPAAAGAPPVAADDAGFALLGIEGLPGGGIVGGVPLQGVVTVAPRQAGSTRGIRIELVLEEDVPARADVPTEEDHHHQIVVATTRLADHVDLFPGQDLRFPFSLSTPQPLPAPSITTRDYRVRWVLRAVLDRPLRRDPVTTLELRGISAP